LSEFPFSIRSMLANPAIRSSSRSRVDHRRVDLSP
jgi:hypothetical protein